MGIGLLPPYRPPSAPSGALPSVTASDVLTLFSALEGVRASGALPSAPTGGGKIFFCSFWPISWAKNCLILFPPSLKGGQGGWLLKYFAQAVEKALFLRVDFGAQGQGELFK